MVNFGASYYFSILEVFFFGLRKLVGLLTLGSMFLLGSLRGEIPLILRFLV